MYKYIVNPKTGRKVKTTGKIGRKVLKQYFNQVGGDFTCENTDMEFMNKHILNHYVNDLKTILINNSIIEGRNVLLLGDGDRHGWNAIILISNFIIKHGLDVELGNVYLEYHNEDMISEDYQRVNNSRYRDDVELIRRAGFTVIGLETTVTSPHPPTQDFADNRRIIVSNPIWTRIINTTIVPNKLNIVSVGSSHNFTFREKRGLKDLLEDSEISVSLYEVTVDCEALLPENCCRGYDNEDEEDEEEDDGCSSLSDELYLKKIDKNLTDLDSDAPSQEVDIIYNFAGCMESPAGAAAGE